MAVIQQLFNIAKSKFFVVGIKAIGGIKFSRDGYVYHVFTGTGPFNVISSPPQMQNSEVEYLVVAGGGGSGLASVTGPTNVAGGGGGGGGGLRTGILNVSIQDYTITVGGGGASASQGSSSTFSSITSDGGGRGAPGNSNALSGAPPSAPPNLFGGSGGSGGGAGSFGTIADPGIFFPYNLVAPGGTGNTPPTTPPQGTNGGNTFATYGITATPAFRYGGGGGGSSSAGGGGGADPVSSGLGGLGLSNPAWSPSQVLLAGIPIPLRPTWAPVIDSKGFSSGGNGTGPVRNSPSPGGVSNTGSGGSDGPGVTGGSGIVVIRYAVRYTY